MKYCIQYQTFLSGIVFTGYIITSKELIEYDKRNILLLPFSSLCATWKIKLKK